MNKFIPMEENDEICVVKLHPHQEKSVEKLKKARKDGKVGYILADEMGLGKTMQCLWFLAEEAKKTTSSFSVLIVVPSAILDMWKDEWEHLFTDIPCFIYHGPNRERIWKQGYEKYLLVTTYGTLLSDFKQGQQSTLFLASSLFKHSWDMLVIDEAHKFSNVVARFLRDETEIPLYKQVFDALIRFFTILITGTPIKNAETDIDALFYLLKIPLKKSMKLQEKVALFDEYHQRTTSEEVDKDALPSLSQEIVNLEYTNHDLEEESQDLRMALAKIQAEMNSLRERGRKPSRGLKRQLMGAIMKCRLFDVVHCTKAEEARNPTPVIRHRLLSRKYNGKLKWLLNFLRQHPNRKIVIASFFTCALELIQEFLQKYDMDSTLFTGKENRKQRKIAKDRFLLGDTPILLLSKEAGGCGISLKADFMIMFEPSFYYAADRQCQSRIRRLGQNHPIKIIYLLFPYDVTLWEKNKMKLALSSQFIRDDGKALMDTFKCDSDEIKHMEAKMWKERSMATTTTTTTTTTTITTSTSTTLLEANEEEKEEEDVKWDKNRTSSDSKKLHHPKKNRPSKHLKMGNGKRKRKYSSDSNPFKKIGYVLPLIPVSSISSYVTPSVEKKVKKYHLPLKMYSSDSFPSSSSSFLSSSSSSSSLSLSSITFLDSIIIFSDEDLGYVARGH